MSDYESYEYEGLTTVIDSSGRGLDATLVLTVGSVASAVFAVLQRDDLDQAVFVGMSVAAGIFAAFYGRRAWQLSRPR